MPNVGPIDGCLIATVARLPMCRNACPRPTVVVVLPSPSGVGVIAVTTMYFALGASASSSIADSLIFTTCSPYGSSRCMPRPTSLAMSSTGFRCAPRAISRSLGNAMPGLLDSGGFESVDLNGELGARREQGVEQVLAGGSLTVQEVGTGAANVVADDVGSQRGDRGPERCAVRRNAVRQLDSADLGKHAGPGRSIKPDQCPAVGEIDPGDGLGGGLRGGLLQHGLQRAGPAGGRQQQPLPRPRAHDKGAVGVSCRPAERDAERGGDLAVHRRAQLHLGQRGAIGQSQGASTRGSGAPPADLPSGLDYDGWCGRDGAARNGCAGPGERLPGTPRWPAAAGPGGRVLRIRHASSP